MGKTLKYRTCVTAFVALVFTAACSTPSEPIEGTVFEDMDELNATTAATATAIRRDLLAEIDALRSETARLRRDEALEASQVQELTIADRRALAIRGRVAAGGDVDEARQELDQLTADIGQMSS